MTAPAEPFDRLHPVIQHHIVNTLGWPALRPLQREAVAPLLAGEDAVLLAPTAGGKTEAALFPLLTRMETERWPGLSLLYVCPLKALLNNLQPRVQRYAGWLGRDANVRHGDVGAGARRRQAAERPSVLLTTPESIEAMLVSRTVDAPRMFRDVRAVVVDEVHAFAGDDRGWHLLAVLDRLGALAERPLSGSGCPPRSAIPTSYCLAPGSEAGGDPRPSSRRRPAVEEPTVGRPTALGLSWRQQDQHRPELSLDYVGSEAMPRSCSPVVRG